jgi:hypothetical protein
MTEIWDYIQNLATTQGLDLLVRWILAFGVLLAGWILAMIIAYLFRVGLKRTEIDNRLVRWLVGEEQGEKLEVERWISRAVFWLLMLFVVVGFFEVLGLEVITEPLNRFLIRVFEYAPRLIGPVVLGAVAWLVASAMRFVLWRGLSYIKLDERLGEQAGIDEEARVPLAKAVSDAVYWLVLLLFLPAILSALDLQGLLLPVQGMVDEVLAFLPNLLAAGLILGLGWLLARIIQRLVSNLLAAVGADSLSEQIGLEKALGEQRLSGLIGLVVYVLILIPVLIAALNSLQLDAITRPASDMLNAILSALPLMFGAALVLLVAYFVGRVVSGLVANLLSGFGFNRVLAGIGLGAEPQEGQRTPSEIVGYLVLVAIMLFATIEAVGLLGFDLLATLVADFMVFAGHVLLGLIIFGVGLFLANLAAKTIETSSASQARLMAVAARVSVTVLAGAMALRQMGLANEIITIAFGLLLGAIAVAFAIAFGIGGRELAGNALKGWLDRVEGQQ